MIVHHILASQHLEACGLIKSDLCISFYIHLLVKNYKLLKESHKNKLLCIYLNNIFMYKSSLVLYGVNWWLLIFMSMFSSCNLYCHKFLQLVVC